MPSTTDLILRSARKAHLEGRTALMQPFSHNRFRGNDGKFGPAYSAAETCCGASRVNGAAGCGRL